MKSCPVGEEKGMKEDHGPGGDLGRGILELGYQQGQECGLMSCLLQ